MSLRKHMFTLAVTGTCVLVGVAFYFGYFESAPPYPSSTDSGAEPADSTHVKKTRIQKQTSTTESVERSSTISVRTEPSGAQVIVESDSVGRSPVEGYRTRSGVVFLSLRKSDFVPIDTLVFTEKDEHLRFTFHLTSVDRDERSSPSGAETDIVAASESVPERVSAPADPPRETTQASPSTPTRSGVPDAPAPPASGAETGTEEETFGTIRATSTPAGAFLWIDGERVGTTPMVLPEVEPGAHRVSFERRGYNPLHTTVVIEGGSTETVSAELSRPTGTFSVLVRPWGSIYIDGELHKSDTDLQYTTRLAAGEHQVRLVHPELGTWQGTVHISPDVRRDTVIDLTQVNTQQPE